MMESRQVILIVASECRPEDVEKYDKWHEEVHVPLVLKFKGIERGARYKVLNDTGEYPKYINVYTFKSQEAFKAYQTSPERAALVAEKKQTWGEGGPVNKWRVAYELEKSWKR